MFLQRNAKLFTWPSPESTFIEARLVAKRPVRRRIRHFRDEQANGKSETLMACLKVMYKKLKNKKTDKMENYFLVVSRQSVS